MKTRYALLSVFSLGLMLCVSSVRASNDPKAFPAYYNDGVVFLTLNPHPVIPNANAQGNGPQTITNGVAMPLYLVLGGVQEINHVISTAPGQPDFSPIWAVYTVTVIHSSVLPLRSEQEIMTAYLNGDVDVSQEPVVYVICPAVSPSP